MNADIILDIDGLVKTYPNGHRAVNGLSFRVLRGSVFGFIGLNGAGKTTTIRIVAGLAGADEGTIRLFGKDIAARDDDTKRRMGFVLDEPLYFDWMTAPAYLHFVGTIYGLDPKTTADRTDELLQFFDLQGCTGDPIETFSTGMKKKLSLAAAVIHTPALVVLDEPLEGIDALASRAIKDTLLLMAERGTTVFLTSHVLDTIERLCTEVAIVDQGRVVLQCRTDEIRTRAKVALPHETYDSLEELFVETVAGAKTRRGLSFL
jgi:ABC-2 type transport system ATP-binding protein